MSGEVLALFDQGYSVEEICSRVGAAPEAVTRTLTMFGQLPRQRREHTVRVRVCPFFDTCRDCTFQRCEFDRFRVVTV